MKRLLFVFAHPDDESLFSGTMAHYVQQGVQVTLVCATKGEAGEISDPSLATPDNLGTAREAELRCACEVIGITNLHLLGYCDSGMDGTPENDLPTAFIQADPDNVRLKLIRIIREVKPHIVVTFEPHGWYGHPDHIAASRYTTEAYHQAGDPTYFPEAGSAWKAERLFYAVLLLSSFETIVDYARQQGMDISNLDGVDFEETQELASKITHILDVAGCYEIKHAVMRCHRTQFDDDNLILVTPREVKKSIVEEERYIQVDPPLDQPNLPHADLFES